MNDWNLVPGYKNIGTKEDVCGGDPTIVGTRLEPIFIASYGLDTIEDFGITKEQYEEAVKWIVQEIKRLRGERDKLIEVLRMCLFNHGCWREEDYVAYIRDLLKEIGVTVE